MASSLVPTETGSVESSASAVNWGPILAGAFAALTITFIGTMVGSGLGLTMVSPWSNESASATKLAAWAAIWLVVVQWTSAGVGGYLTGRLRTKWVGVHTDETFFRDTAHGFMAWAIATVLVMVLFGSALSSAIGTGVQAVSTVASGAATGAASGSVSNARSEAGGGPTVYLVDTLFRPADMSKPAAAGAEGDAIASSQASRILIAGATSGKIPQEDRVYLGQLVAARTGLAPAEATARVDAMLRKVDAAKVSAQEAADKARKAAAKIALLGALSMIIGALVAGAAAAFGGSQRDEEEAIFIKSQTRI